MMNRRSLLLGLGAALAAPAVVRAASLMPVRALILPPPKWVNVLDYGAIPDGVTSATAAFQKAIAAVADGGTVFMPAGRYALPGPISLLDRSLTLQGDGVGTRLTRIEFWGTAPELTIADVGIDMLSPWDR